MNGRDNHHSVQLLLEELKRLLPAQFEELLLVLKVPVEYLPSREAAHAMRAVDLIRWAENTKVLDRLDMELNRFRPQLPPVSGGPPELEDVLHTPQPKTFINSIGMEFVLIPRGEFLMGSAKHNDEKPVHKVTIGNPFYLGKYQVTKKEWKTVMGENPWSFKYAGSDRLPVVRVSWQACQRFIERLNIIEPGVFYRLPSESEWEYACRAGTAGDYAGNLDEMAKYSKGFWQWLQNLVFGPAPVGTRKGNDFGLYDMHGNVWEWCQDRWHENYDHAPEDGSAWETGNNEARVLRGGSWYDFAYYCRSAYRDRYIPTRRNFHSGLRVVMIPART